MKRLIAGGLVFILAGASAVALQTEEAKPSTPPAHTGGEPQIRTVTPNEPQPAPTTGPAPKLELSATEWDFGTLWEGDPVKTEFTVKNTGEGTLKLVSVRASCSCTAVKPSKESLAPGETASVPVSVDSMKRKGPIDATVNIETNDPNQPIARFHVKGMIKPIFEMKNVSTTATNPNAPITPMVTTAVTFGRISADAMKSMQLEIVNQGQETADMKLEGPVEGFDAKLEPVEAGKKYMLTVATKPPLKAGSAQQTLTIKTGVTKIPELKIPITCLVMARVSVSPTQLSLPQTIQRAMQRPITLTYSTDKPVKITEVRVVGCAQVTAEVLPPTTMPAVKSQDGFDRHNIRLNLPANVEIPEAGATVEIMTDDPEFAKLTVPIRRLPMRTPNVQVPTTGPSGAVLPTTNASVRPHPARP